MAANVPNRDPFKSWNGDLQIGDEKWSPMKKPLENLWEKSRIFVHPDGVPTNPSW